MSRPHEYLTRIARLLQAEERAADASLQPVQLHALDYLDRCNRYSDRPAAVGEFLRVTKGTASQTLRVLEREGLIEKRSDARDRRIVRLRVTPSGRRLLRRTMPPPMLRTALDGLSPAELETLTTALEGLLRRLQIANDGRTFGVCHTCRHLLREEGHRYRCGLTTERLSSADTRRICREHEPAAA